MFLGLICAVAILWCWSRQGHIREIVAQEVHLQVSNNANNLLVLLRHHNDIVSEHLGRGDHYHKGNERCEVSHASISQAFSRVFGIYPQKGQWYSGLHTIHKPRRAGLDTRRRLWLLILKDEIKDSSGRPAGTTRF